MTKSRMPSFTNIETLLYYSVKILHSYFEVLGIWQVEVML